MSRSLVTAAAVVGLGHAATSLGERLVHRLYYHGHARFVRWTAAEVPFLLWPLWVWLRAGFVHHWLVHHKHAHRCVRELESTGKPSEALCREADAMFPDESMALFYSHYGMGCHGFGAWHHTSTLLFTPMPLVWASLLCLDLPLSPVLLSVLFWSPAIFYMLSSCKYHEFLHMDRAHRHALAPWWLRWLLCSAEGDRLAEDHQNHHFGAQHDALYNIVPLARFWTASLDGRGSAAPALASALALSGALLWSRSVGA
eukprot:Amastigsp_a852412_7.p1 type:complete len:256 gc:universal Amastigsp_a852412_7:897-130(-)